MGNDLQRGKEVNISALADADGVIRHPSPRHQMIYRVIEKDGRDLKPL